MSIQDTEMFHYKKQSLRKVKNLKAETYYCYHGGKFTL